MASSSLSTIPEDVLSRKFEALAKDGSRAKIRAEYDDFQKDLIRGRFTRLGSVCDPAIPRTEPKWEDVKVKLDTAADVNLVARTVVERLGAKIIKGSRITAKGIGGAETYYDQYILLRWTLNESDTTYLSYFCVSEDSSIDLLIGQFELDKHGLVSVNLRVFSHQALRVHRPEGRLLSRNSYILDICKKHWLTLHQRRENAQARPAGRRRRQF
jgi:hypothetical protein